MNNKVLSFSKTVRFSNLAKCCKLFIYSVLRNTCNLPLIRRVDDFGKVIYPTLNDAAIRENQGLGRSEHMSGSIWARRTLASSNVGRLSPDMAYGA